MSKAPPTRSALVFGAAIRQNAFGLLAAQLLADVQAHYIPIIVGGPQQYLSNSTTPDQLSQIGRNRVAALSSDFGSEPGVASLIAWQTLTTSVHASLTPIAKSIGRSGCAFVPPDYVSDARNTAIPEPDRTANELNVSASDGGSYYDLPGDLLSEYHELLARKYSAELSDQDAARLEEVGQLLDEADEATGLEQSNLRTAHFRNANSLAVLNQITALLSRLVEEA